MLRTTGLGFIIASRPLQGVAGGGLQPSSQAVLLDAFPQEQISSEEYTGMTFPQYYKTVEEFMQPLSSPASPVYGAGLRLEHCETRVVGCPFAAEFRRHGDAKRFAREYIPTLRLWTESTFLGARSERRTLEERRGIIDNYYQAYETLVRESPAGHAMDYVHVYMTIAKVGA